MRRIKGIRATLCINNLKYILDFLFKMETAIYRNDLKELTKLVKLESKSNLKSSTHLLHIAIRMRSFEILEFLVKSGINPCDPEEKCLILSMKHGDYHMIEFILNMGANPSARDNKAFTMVMKRTRHERLILLKLLVERIKILFSDDQWSLTNSINDTMESMSPYGEIELMDSLLSNKPSELPLHSGKTELLEYLLSNKPSEHCIHKVVIEASRTGDIETLEIIDRHGMDFTLNQNEALIIASQYSSQKALIFLKKKGVDFSFRNSQVLTEIMRSGSEKIIKFLVESGADPCANTSALLNTNSYTYERKKMAIYLIENGMDVKAQSRVLVIASKENNLPMFKYFVENGADVNEVRDELEDILKE